MDSYAPYFETYHIIGIYFLLDDISIVCYASLYIDYFDYFNNCRACLTIKIIKHLARQGDKK
ncbi:hypothetical protein DFO56_103319 [Kosakonia sp. AG348]|nr:hypothetical protein DFO56_103319 [Kosakonia sp. AG348]